MNTTALGLLTTDANETAIVDSLEAVTRLITSASASFSHEAQVHLAGLLRSGAQVDVHFTLTNERKQIAATIEGIPFFTVDIGEPPAKENTRH